MTTHERRPPSYPPPQERLTRPYQYASMTDSVVWITALLAFAAEIALYIKGFGWSNPRIAGIFGIFCTMAFIIVFSVGLLISKVGYYLGGKSKRSRRIGFALGV